jgi:chromosome segregation protein
VFRFLELSVNGWDLWSAVRVPLDRDVVLLVGPNGSGKTTLLDALRQLLNAPRLSSRRRIQHYVRHPEAPVLLRAVVENRNLPGTGPPFRRERIVEPEVTLACALVPSGGSPEKRFAILPGRAPVEACRRALLESREFYGPERYARALEQAGVTRSLMNVLAIEQGRTNALFELSPRQLLQYVLEMLGDRTVLERYQEARRRYEDTEREVARQTTALQARQAELAAVLRSVERLEQWERARDRQVELAERLPAAQLQALWRERANASAKLLELRTKVRNGETEAARLRAATEQARERERAAVAGRKAAALAAGEARETLERAVAAAERAARTLDDLEAKAAELARLPAQDLAALERRDEEAARAFFAAEREAGMARARRDAAAERVRRLEAGMPVHPPAVEATLVELRSRGIAAELLAAAVEAPGPDGAAVEAALGDARFALLVDEAVARAAFEAAAAHGFPGPVFAGERTGAAECCGPLELSAKAPTWLRSWAAELDTSADGSWRDRRGAWVARPVDRVLGEAGRRAALERARVELTDAERGCATASGTREFATAERREAAEALERERRRRALIRETAELPRAREAEATAGRARSEARAETEARDAARASAAAEEAAARFDAESADRRVEEFARQLAGEGEALRRTEDLVVSCDRRIDAEFAGVPVALRQRAERGELDGADTVRADLDRARADLERLGEPPQPEVRAEADNLTRNVEELEGHVAARRAEAEQSRAELSECRRRHVETVHAALGDYRRRAIEVGRTAEVVVEMDLPRLENDDRVLDEAAIHARFGFDGKDPLPLGDPSFSGGQQVVAGLVLLIAMVELEGRGFFILDEPFAHLSVDRVDHVGRFLRAAGAQFIITAPTTLDRAQLDPASLVLMLRKKRPDEPHAPAPVVAEA